MPLQEMAKVIDNRQVQPGYYLMKISAPQVAQEAKPGQFVHVKVGSTMDPLLRRPISLYDIDSAAGTITLLYVVVGRGTQMLSAIKAGADLDIMGPLGTGFWLPEKASRCLVIGGGIGVAPLLPLVKTIEAAGLEQRILYGFRSADAVVGVETILDKKLPFAMTTDDGSAGQQGFITDLVKQAIDEFSPDYFFTCGPEIMIEKVAAIMESAGIDGQVSLEARMGCGVGACLACTCKTKVAGKEKNKTGFGYKLVCTHGPVFPAKEVIFNG